MCQWLNQYINAKINKYWHTFINNSMHKLIIKKVGRGSNKCTNKLKKLKT